MWREIKKMGTNCRKDEKKNGLENDRKNIKFAGEAMRGAKTMFMHQSSNEKIE